MKYDCRNVSASYFFRYALGKMTIVAAEKIMWRINFLPQHGPLMLFNDDAGMNICIHTSAPVVACQYR